MGKEKPRFGGKNKKTERKAKACNSCSIIYKTKPIDHNYNQINQNMHEIITLLQIGDKYLKLFALS